MQMKPWQIMAIIALGATVPALVATLVTITVATLVTERNDGWHPMELEQAVQRSIDIQPTDRRYTDSEGRTWLSSGQAKDNFQECLTYVEQYNSIEWTGGTTLVPDPHALCLKHWGFWNDLNVTVTVTMRTATAEASLRDLRPR